MPALKNARHELFAQELSSGATADAAYEAAGFKPNRGNATRLKANESIAARLAEIQNKAAERVVVTIDDIARQLDEDRAFARQCGSAAASVAATMGKAKVLGLVIDKAETTAVATMTVTYVTNASGPAPAPSEEDYETPA